MDNELNEHHEREPYYEDEIDLYQLIQVLLKRKKLIVGVFLVAVIVAIAASYIMKPVYRVSAVVAPGLIYEQEPVRLEPERDVLIWREKAIDTPENIERLISQNPFHYEILTQLSWNYQDPQNQFDIKTNVQQRTSYISVNIDSSEPERAKEYLYTLLDRLQAFYRTKIEANVTLLNNEKKRFINEKQSINNQIELIKANIKILDTQSERLQKQIEEIRRNNEQIIKQRDAVLAKGHNPEDAMTLLLYSNTIQQNLAQIDQLNLKLEDNSFQRQQLNQDMKNLATQLANLDLRLEEIDSLLANIDIKAKEINNIADGSESQQVNSKTHGVELYGIKIVQEPTIDPQRVSPKRTLMVAVAGVLGLFVGIFAAFAVEFWQSHKVSA